MELNLRGLIGLVLLLAVTSHASVLRFTPQRHPNDVTYDVDPDATQHQAPDVDDITERSGDVSRLQFVNPSYVIRPKNPHGKPTLPANVTRKVLVIGASLAGLSAATELAIRGYDVTVREASALIGGRMASRVVTVRGETFHVDNNFVSIFSNHYQILQTLRHLRVTPRVTQWTTINYHFLKYKPEAFNNNGHNYPADMLSLLYNSPNINFLDTVKTVFEAGKFVNFDYDTVYQQYDGVAFEKWVLESGIPQDFYDIFLDPMVQELKNNDTTVSAAEMMVSFYLRYLSTITTAQANRLLPNRGNWGSLIRPWIDFLTKGKKVIKKVKFELSKPFNGFNFARSGHHVTGDVTDTTAFDYCVLAVSPDAAKKIFTRTRKAWSGLLPAVQAVDRILTSGVADMKTALPYVTMRLWLNKPTNPDRPFVIFTPDRLPLKTLALVHTYQNQSATWAQKTKGSVIDLELMELGQGQEELQAPDYLKIACEVLTELCNATVVGNSKFVTSNMPSLDVGQGRLRPNVTLAARSGVENLFLAGDWVQTMYPSAEGEKAVSTGLQAANEILIRDGVKQAKLMVSSSQGPGWT